MAKYLEYYQNSFAGLNTNSEMSLQNIEATTCSNVKIDNDGSLMSRLGYAERNGTAVTGTPNMMSIYRWEAESKFIASGGTNLYLGAETSPYNFSSIKSSLTSGGKWEFVPYQDQLYMCDGNDNLKYDGTNVVTWGIETPTVTSTTATATGSDSFGGDYNYKISYVVNNAQEGNASAAIAVDDTGATYASIELADIPTGEADTVSRKIYRTNDGGEVYYYLATISDNTTTTYSDTTVDASLGTATAPSDKGAPPTCKFCVEHNNFIFVVNASTPTRLQFSTQTDADIFPALNYWDFPRDITGICSFAGSLWVFTQNRIYPIHGNDTTDFQRDMVSYYGPGTVSHRSIVKTELGIFYLAKDGVYNFNGSAVQLVSARIAGDENNEIEDILDTYKANACAVYFKGKYYLSVTSSGTTNNETYIFDTVANREKEEVPAIGHWSIYTYGFNDFSVWEDGTLFGAGNSGYVYQLESGNDDGVSDTNITLSYATKPLTLYLREDGTPGIFRVREVIVWASLATDTLTVKFDVQNETQTQNYTKSITTDIGSTVKPIRFSVPSYLTGLTCKVTFGSISDEQCKIEAFAIRYIPLRRR